MNGVTPNAGYEKDLTIPPSAHVDDHDHDDHDHDDHDNDGHDHDGDGKADGKGSAETLGAAAVAWLTTLFFSL